MVLRGAPFIMRTFLDVPVLDVQESVEYCDELLVSNEDGLLLRVAGGDKDIPSTLKIDHFLKISDVNGKFICWGGMSFQLYVVGHD